MELAMRLFEVGNGQAKIAFGGGQVFVAEDFLDVAQVGIVLQKVRRAGVAPHVAGDVLFYPGAPGVFFQK